MRKTPMKTPNSLIVTVAKLRAAWRVQSIIATNAIRSGMRTALVVALTATVALPPVAMAQSPTENTANINFVGADIESVVKAIGHYTGVTFLIDPRVKGQVNLVSEAPLTKAQAFKLMTSTLRLQGFSVVAGDGYYKVVPEADAKLQPGPTQAEGVKGDQVATQIFRLNYESANNIVTVLRPLISPNNTINANPGNNTVVITDYADNITRMGKIIAALDVPSSNDLDVVPIKHAIASDIATMVTKLIEGAAGAADPIKTILLADSRSNSVLIRAPSVARANLVKSIIEKLDQPTALPGNVHVVYLKNAEAVKLAGTLRAIMGGGDNSSQSNAGSSQPLSITGINSTNPANNGGVGGLGNAFGGGGSSLMSPSTGSNNQSGPQGGAIGGGFIQADPSTNALIITASEPVYKNMRGIIEQLDARRAQVYIEALIVDISGTKASELGVQWLGVSGDSNSKYRVGGGTSFSSKGNNILGLAQGLSGLNSGDTTAAAAAAGNLPGNGITVGIFQQIGGKLGLGALAHALENSGSGKVLSIPTIITLDNEEAKLIAGKTVPFVSGSVSTAGGVNQPFTTVERKDVGLSLKVRPQISQGGTIKMSIYQEVSSVDESSKNSPTGLITNKNAIESNVLVEDGEIIALGGLTQDNLSDSFEGVPYLSSIPFLGNLFKYQTKSRNKSTLMIFIRPIVLRSADETLAVSTDRYDYMRTQMAPSNGVDGIGLKLQKGKLINSDLSAAPAVSEVQAAKPQANQDTKPAVDPKEAK
jgi:general secretion pathway protein D